MSQTGATLNDLMHLWDGDLFDDIVLPDGMDKTTVVNQIMLDNGLLEVVYPEHDLLKGLIKAHFLARQLDYQRLWDAVSQTYNPLYNLDRKNTLTERTERSENTTGNTTSNTTRDTSINTTINSNQSTEQKVSAFDSSTYQPSEQMSGNTNDITNGNTIDNTNGNTDATTDTQGQDVHTLESHEEGSIGVITPQDMLRREFDIRKDWNIYKFISMDFRDNFMIQLI